MAFTTAAVFPGITATEADNGAAMNFELKLPLTPTNYQADQRLFFPALFDRINTGINALNPKPQSITVSKTTATITVGTTPVIRTTYTITVNHTAVPGNLLSDS